jgi:cytoskeletal protein CcmA (bactofilin family)
VFNKDGLFGKKDEGAPGAVNVTPDLRGATMRPQPAAQPEVLATRALPEAPKAASAAEENAGSKLIVGPDIKLKGVEITDCDTLVVEGRVEASMDSRVVQIAESGVFTGTATMDYAEIWGSFEGSLTVRRQLVIHATGRVKGEIRYGTVRIEEGGEISGNVSTISGASKGTSYEPVARSAKQAAKAGAA